MNIIEFFELSAGKWFSQRTLHNLKSGQLQAGKSNLIMESLPQTDATVVQLCQQHKIDPTTISGGFRLTWDGTMEGNPNQQKGSAIVVPIINPEHPQEGQLLQSQDTTPNQSLSGRYSLGADEVLTLITESPNFYAEERLWYLMPNLRLRTSIVKNSTGLTQASFCSEIRMGIK
ncbi:Chromophore lyase CpcS/CpeS 1 [Planktothrix serta PCC 8927]|uniref:Chromophore lyase CpcS/CpeS n=1 Tax=Planktothrix serta PCC 8927 TaxID=671068 RepID=A0A7Z9C4U5_9CYAN|nr:phycobiliprotein lyase [Planktothrix serta]VXD25613.1 Chromophore lyase CpcS/CpeS 1 [Planktothrix serta PCC 8927]